MTLLDVSLAVPEENLALDEILLNEAEQAVRQGQPAHETLRFWEISEPCVVLGSTGRIRLEVNHEVCRALRAPVLRRHSGGGTVVLGPGCLSFSLVLSIDARPELHDLHHSYEVILDRIAECLSVPGLRRLGTSDLVVGDLKVSGSAQRRKSGVLLHHGTLLYDFDSREMTKFLKDPPKQPQYRRKRSHEEFVTNLPLPAELIRSRIASCWNAVEGEYEICLLAVKALAQEKYASPEWIYKF